MAGRQLGGCSGPSTSYSSPSEHTTNRMPHLASSNWGRPRITLPPCKTFYDAAGITKDYDSTLQVETAGAYNGTMEVPLSTPRLVPPCNLTQEIEDPLRSSTETLSQGDWSMRAGPHPQPDNFHQDPVTPRKTGDASLQFSQRPQNPVDTPSTSEEDSTPGSPRKKRQPARLSQSSAPADARKFSSKKAHAKKEAHRRGRVSEIMDKLESMVVVYCDFKESQNRITKEEILNASYGLLKDWEADKKELAEVIQELEKKIQALESRVHDLGGRDLGWNKEAPLLREGAQGGRMPSPPSSNQTSPVRGPHHQSGSGGIGAYQANRFK